MATRRVVATSRARELREQAERAARVPAPSPLEELTAQVKELSETVAALSSRDSERASHESSSVVELLAKSLSQVAERRSPRAGSESDDDVIEPADDCDNLVSDIRVADPRFRSLLSVATYRLARRRHRVLAREVSRLAKKAAELRPRVTKLFSGIVPLDVLPFLVRVREIAEEAGLTEGVLLRLLPDLLAEPALTSFRNTKPSSYPAAIKWLLLTYAPETAVAEEWRELQQLRQDDPETATEFAMRLQSAAHRLGNLVTPAELKALYEGGLQDGTRHLLRATLPPDPDRSLSDTIAAAEALSQAVRASRGDRKHLSAERPARLSTFRKVLALPAESESVDSVEPDSSDYEVPLGCELVPEVDVGTIVCYGGPYPNNRTSPRPQHSTRLCWTCWLPGHFAEDCPVVPAHLRLAIAERRRVALARSGPSRAFSDRNPYPRGPPWERARTTLTSSRPHPDPTTLPEFPAENGGRREGDALAPRL
jgi:hypothetical protein